MVEAALSFLKQVKDRLPRPKSKQIRVEAIAVMVDRLFDGTIEQEKMPVSSKLLAVKSYDSQNQEIGDINANFYIERGWNLAEQAYTEEKDRYVWLSDVWVTEDKKYRRKGTAKRMIGFVEEYAKRFNANRIAGRIIPEDRKKQPWLPEMYRKLGYEVKEGEGDWSIEKRLK